MTFPSSKGSDKVIAKMSTFKYTFFLWVVLFATQASSLPTNVTQSVVAENKSRRICGMRHFALPSLANTEFPWTIRLTIPGRNGEERVLCSGAAVSQYVAVVAAHCVAGREKLRLVVAQPPMSADQKTSTKYFDVLNVVVHHEYNATVPTGKTLFIILPIQFCQFFSKCR